MALTGIAVALFLLMGLGGPAVLIEDPWLFGVAIAPGIELALPWFHGRTGVASESGPIPAHENDEAGAAGQGTMP